MSYLERNIEGIEPQPRLTYPNLQERNNTGDLFKILRKGMAGETLTENERDQAKHLIEEHQTALATLQMKFKDKEKTHPMQKSLSEEIQFRKNQLKIIDIHINLCNLKQPLPLEHLPIQ